MCTHAYLHTRRTSELVSLRSHEMTVFSIQRLMRDGGDYGRVRNVGGLAERPSAPTRCC